MTNTDYSKIDACVDGVKDAIKLHSETIWEYAETSYQEFKSSAFIQELLESKGFTISDRGIGGLETSWIATFANANGDGPCVGIMVEYDALPGLGNDITPTQSPSKSGNTNGHGCGHNLIGSTSVGAALALKNYMEAEGIKGTLQVYGCPAEEMLNGKNYMALDGAFKKADVVLHNHPGPINTVWNFHSAGSVDLNVEFKGVAAHAGMCPWKGRSALHAMEVFMHSLNCMREQMVPTARLHFQVLSGGSAVNVIPDYTKILVRYRGPSASNMKKHIDWIKDMAKGAAMATQTKEVVANLGGIHDCLANDTLGMHMNKLMTDRYFPVPWTSDDHAFAKSIQKEISMPEVGMGTTILPFPKGVEVGGSSDVGTVSRMVPTMGVIYTAWPVGVPPHQWGVTACVGGEIGLKASIQAAKTMAAVGVDCFTDPELLKAAKAEFDKNTSKDPFISLCESNKSPAGALDAAHRHVYECCIHGAMGAFGLEDGT